MLPRGRRLRRKVDSAKSRRTVESGNQGGRPRRSWRRLRHKTAPRPTWQARSSSSPSGCQLRIIGCQESTPFRSSADSVASASKQREIDTPGTGSRFEIPSVPPGSRREPSREASIERYLSALETADRQEGELAEGSPSRHRYPIGLLPALAAHAPRAAGRSDFVPWRNWCVAVLIASLPTAAVRRIHDIAEKDRALNCRSYPKFYRPNSDASTSHPIACSRGSHCR